MGFTLFDRHSGATSRARSLTRARPRPAGRPDPPNPTARSRSADQPGRLLVSFGHSRHRSASGPGRAERPEEGAPGVRGIGVKTPRHKRLHASDSDWATAATRRAGQILESDGRHGRLPRIRRGPCIRITDAGRPPGAASRLAPTSPRGDAGSRTPSGRKPAAPVSAALRSLAPASEVAVDLCGHCSSRRSRRHCELSHRAAERISRTASRRSRAVESQRVGRLARRPADRQDRPQAGLAVAAAWPGPR